MFVERPAIAKMQGIILVVVILAAGVGAAVFLGSNAKAGNTIDVSLIESDPVNQVDTLNPMNITVTHDTTVTLAIQNGDDEARTFEISAFSVNATIDSGQTQRVTFSVGAPGVFMIYISPEPAYPGFRASPSVTGYVIVT